MSANPPAAELEIPEGFRPIRIGGPFIVHNGPLYARLAGEKLQLGFRVEPRHTNPLKICHGGMMASFADMLLPCAAMYQGTSERRFLPTISLQIDYLAASPLGAWVQGEGEVLRTTRNMLFAQGLITADGEPVLRVSGIFKMGQLIGDGSDRDPLRLHQAAGSN
ncbi:MAG: PaaI family thioesterase [Burkholderiaceae bacterium]|nr:PaaI family thioesterase [Burkholderiaceae bacterium]